MLPKKQRLTRSSDIKKVLRKRENKTRTPLFDLYTLQNNLNHSRISVITPSSLGKAHIRNKIRRLMTEAIKTIYNNITKTIDMVVYPKLAVNSSKYDDIVVALRNEMGKINVNY